MGEDDDEQTGNYRYYPQHITGTAENGTNLGLTTTSLITRENSGTKLSSQNEDHENWRNDKPKYKRQEFMRFFNLLYNEF